MNGHEISTEYVTMSELLLLHSYHVAADRHVGMVQVKTCLSPESLICASPFSLSNDVIQIDSGSKISISADDLIVPKLVSSMSGVTLCLIFEPSSNNPDSVSRGEGSMDDIAIVGIIANERGLTPTMISSCLNEKVSSASSILVANLIGSSSPMNGSSPKVTSPTSA